MLCKHILTGKISILRFLKIHTYNIYKYCNNDTKYHSPQYFPFRVECPFIQMGSAVIFQIFHSSKILWPIDPGILLQCSFSYNNILQQRYIWRQNERKKSYLFFFLADPQRDFCLQIELLQSFFWFAKLKVGPYSLSNLDKVNRSFT